MSKYYFSTQHLFDRAAVIRKVCEEDINTKTNIGCNNSNYHTDICIVQALVIKATIFFLWQRKKRNHKSN